MSYFCIFFFLIIGLSLYSRDKTFFSPAVSFTFLFVIIFIFATSGWYGMYQASTEAYLLISLGVLSFIFGTVANKKYSTKFAFYRTGKPINTSDLLKTKIYWSMLFICLSVLSVSIINILMFVLSGGTIGDVYVVAAAATDGATNELTKNSSQLLLESYIGYPLLYLLVPVSLVEFFSTYKNKYLIVAISLALLCVALDARRTYLTVFVLMIILCVYMHRKDFRYFSSDLLIKFHKSRKYALLLVPLFISLFIFVSSQRSIAADGKDNSSFLQTLTQYYGASVQFFGSSIHRAGIDDYTFGFSALRGFFAPFFGILKFLGMDSPSVLNDANTYLEFLHSHLLRISPEKNYNSFATCFFQFYCDGGIIGIVLLSFLYGYYAQHIFEKMVILKSKRAESTYVFFFANILMLSFVNMETVLALNFWPLVLVKFLYPNFNRLNTLK